MFGPGVSTMPSETRAKPIREVKWGMAGLAGVIDALLARVWPRCHFENCTESNSAAAVLRVSLSG